MAGISLYKCVIDALFFTRSTGNAVACVATGFTQDRPHPRILAKIFLIPRSVYFFFHDDSNKITSTAVGTLYDTAIYENVDDLKKGHTARF